MFFAWDGILPIAVKYNRIYAVTRKNRIITSCLSAIAISQFIFGLYWTAYGASEGGESPTRCYLQSLLISVLQRNRTCRSHLTYIRVVLSCKIGPWKSHLPLYLLYMVRNFLCSLSGGRHQPRSSHRPHSILAHRLSRGAVQYFQDPDDPSIQNYSTRRDVLFPGYIHFARRISTVFIIHDGKGIVILFRPYGLLRPS